METIHQAPEEHGIARSRWTLKLLVEHCCAFSNIKTLAGAWKKLHRARIHWRRGRLSVTSPDPCYTEKLAKVEEAIKEAGSDPGNVRVLYGDEVSCYRQPLVRQDWQGAGAGGKRQKQARLYHGANYMYRFIATMDASTGRVLYRGNSRITVERIAGFLRYVRRSYDRSIRLYLVWDNWPMHYYDQVREAAEQCNITLLYLPTYAPWTNPIEKLWRKLKDEILAMHRYSTRWPQLRAMMGEFLQGYDRDAPDLLRYVGIAR